MKNAESPSPPSKKPEANTIIRDRLQRGMTVLRQDVRSFWDANKKTFCALLLLHLIGISAIVRANVFYIDDVRRAVGGFREFGFGRKLSDFLAILVHADTSVWDISPLTQLLAVCFLSAAGCIVIYLLSEKRKFDLWTVIAVLPLGLSPYFLECLSYKFDCPYMALSILLSVLPFLFYKYGLPLYCAVSFVGCLFMCMLYQASSGIYPMLTALLCFHWWNSGRPLKDVFRFWLASASSYCLGLVAFRILFATDTYSYVDSSVSLSMLPKNLRAYFTYIRLDFKFWWLALILLIAAFFVYAAARDTAIKSRALSGLIAAVTVLVMLPLSYGAYSVLEKPWTDPRAMYGFGVFIAFIGVYAAARDTGMGPYTMAAYIAVVTPLVVLFFSFGSAGGFQNPLTSPGFMRGFGIFIALIAVCVGVYAFGAKIRPAKLACLCLSWAFFVFAFTYGNALADNQRYQEFRTEAAIQDICETEVFLSAARNNQIIRVQIKGAIDKTPLLSRSDVSQNLLRRLVPNIVNGSWAHGRVYFQYHYGIGDYVVMDFSEDFQQLNLPVLKDTFFHTIRGDSEHILIEFKH